MIKRFLASVVLGFSSVSAFSAIYYVDAERSSNTTCTSWASACEDITAAVNLSAQGDEIWIKGGAAITHADGSCESTSPLVYDLSGSTINLKSNILLAGGFKGDETANVDVKPDCYVVEIIPGGSPATSMISASSLSSASRIDGVTIKDSDGAIALNVSGSELYINDVNFINNSRSTSSAVNASSAILHISKSNFFDNEVTVQGVISAASSTLNISDSEFDSNTALRYGSVLSASGATLLNITNSKFIGNMVSAANSAEEGGALSLNTSSLTLGIVDSTFDNNQVQGSGDVGAGAALLVNATGSVDIDIDGVSFINNQSGFKAGAVQIRQASGVLAINNSLFANNSSAHTGALQLQPAGLTATIANSTFFNNSDDNWAGALTNWSGNTTLTHVTMVDNSSVNGVGAIRSQNSGSINISKSLFAGNGAGFTHLQSGAINDDGQNVLSSDDGSLHINSISGITQARGEIVATTLRDYSGATHVLMLPKNSQARDVILNLHEYDDSGNVVSKAGGVAGCESDVNDGSPLGEDARQMPRPERLVPDSIIPVFDAAAETQQAFADCDAGAVEFNNAFAFDCVEEDGLRYTLSGLHICDVLGSGASPGDVFANVAGSMSLSFLTLLFGFGFFRERL